MNCGLCHKCNAPLKKVLDGEQYCPTCETYQRYESHGFAGWFFADKSACRQLSNLDELALKIDMWAFGGEI